MATARRQGEQKHPADIEVLKVTEGSPTMLTDEQFPGLQLGFHWGPGDWALLALCSVIISAIVAYGVIMAVIQ